ncbi:MAG: hypothetical protein V1928_01575 [Parcubacteria group bacterium]
MKKRVLIVCCDTIRSDIWSGLLWKKLDLYIARSCHLAEKALAKHSFDALVVDDSIIKVRLESEEEALFKRIRAIANAVAGPKIAASNAFPFIRYLRKAGLDKNANHHKLPEEILRLLKVE